MGCIGVLVPHNATFSDVAAGVTFKLDVACCMYMGGATLGLEPKDISFIYNGKRRDIDQTLQVAFDEAVEEHGYEVVAHPLAPTHPQTKMVLKVLFTNGKLPRASMEKHPSDGSKNDSTQCPVCLEDLNGFTADRSVALKCGHIMHLACFGRWADVFDANTSPTCPVCRLETGLRT